MTQLTPTVFLLDVDNTLPRHKVTLVKRLVAAASKKVTEFGIDTVDSELEVERMTPRWRCA